MRLLLAALLLSACAKKPPSARFVSSAARFEGEFPAGWRTAERDSQARFPGAESTAADDASLSVTFYPSGNDEFPGPADFEKAHTRAGGPRNIEPGLTTSGSVAGLPCAEFTRTLTQPSELAHPGTAMSDRKEAYCLVETKAGFYSLQYSAPAAVFDKDLPAFDRLKATFHPKAP